MTDPRFFASPEQVSLSEIAADIGAELHGDGTRVVSGIAPIERAGTFDLTFLDNPTYVPAFRSTRAGGCVVAPELAGEAPEGVTLLLAKDPYRAFAQAAARLYPAAMRPGAIFEDKGIAPGAIIHPDAKLEPNVTVDPGAVIGARAEVGSGTTIAANAVIGPDVRIGRDCVVGLGAGIVHALIGNRVIIHTGVRIGQDGFGFAMGPKGHLKVPQIGRVVIQDDVEIGASSCIDRGSTRDTIIGEGTKIDNLVQIAHNVIVGRHCVIVSQVGISGSCTIGDFVVIGGQAGLAGHLDVGAGAHIAAKSGVMSNVPAGARIGGAPALPMREWFRMIAIMRKLARKGEDGGSGRS